MPIYEYRCSDCGHRFDHLARTREQTASECPACGARALEKQWSTFSASVAPDRAAAPPCASGHCSPSSCASGACPLA